MKPPIARISAARRIKIIQGGMTVVYSDS